MEECIYNVKVAVMINRATNAHDLIKGIGPFEDSLVTLIQYVDDTQFFYEAKKKIREEYSIHVGFI